MENQKRKNVLIGVLIAIIIILLCTIGYLLFGRNMLSTKNGDNSNATKIESSTIKNGNCINIIGKDRGKSVTFSTDLGVDVKFASESTPEIGSIYIGNKLVSSDYILTRVCVYNKYIVLGLGEGSSESFKIYNVNGNDVVGKFLPAYEIANNILTTYEVNYDNKSMTKLTIDLTGDTPRISQGTKENYTCTNSCSNSRKTLKDKIIYNDCCSE